MSLVTKLEKLIGWRSAPHAASELRDLTLPPPVSHFDLLYAGTRMANSERGRTYRYIVSFLDPKTSRIAVRGSNDEHEANKFLRTRNQDLPRSAILLPQSDPAVPEILHLS